MNIDKQIPLPQLQPGQKGKVVDVSGGLDIVKKLAALGIRPGQTVAKKESIFARGPVIIRVNTAEVAIGYRMAQKVLVEVEEG
jgi:ferrous iron transport protein A